MFNILETKNKWCAPPIRYYGNLKVFFLERMGTHAFTLSVLVTKGHRFSLIHNNYSVIKNKSYTHKVYIFLEDPSYIHCPSDLTKCYWYEYNCKDEKS